MSVLRIVNYTQPTALGLIMGGDITEDTTVVVQVRPDEHDEGDVIIDVLMSNCGDDYEESVKQAKRVLKAALSGLRSDVAKHASKSVSFMHDVQRDLDALDALELHEEGDDENSP